MMRMLRAFKSVNKVHSTQHFVTFWTNIHSKLMPQYTCGFSTLLYYACYKLIVALLISKLDVRHDSDINFQG